MLDPEIDSKNHGFLNFQDTPLIPYDNLWLHNIPESIYFYILKIPSTENEFFVEKKIANLNKIEKKHYLFAYGSSALTDITQGKTIVGGHLTSASGLNKLNGHCAKLFDGMPKTKKYLIKKEFFKSYEM